MGHLGPGSGSMVWTKHSESEARMAAACSRPFEESHWRATATPRARSATSRCCLWTHIADRPEQHTAESGAVQRAQNALDPVRSKRPDQRLRVRTPCIRTPSCHMSMPQQEPSNQTHAPWFEPLLTPVGARRKIHKRTDIVVAFHPKYSKYRIHRETCEINYSLT